MAVLQIAAGVTSVEQSVAGKFHYQRVDTWTRQSAIILVGLTLIALALRLYDIDGKSIWYDEAFVITLGQMSIPEMLSALVQLDPHPPLYYLVMHFWLMLGSDPMLVRLPSAVLSTLSVPLLYLVGLRLSNRSVALGAAALLTFSPFHVEWAQEARMYALLGILCLGSTYYLVKGIQEGGSASWIAHSLLTAASVYTQLNAAFYLTAQALAVLVLVTSRQCPRSVLGSWLKSQVAAVLMFLPWFPAFVAQNLTYGDPGLAFLTLGGMEALLLQFGYGYIPYWRVPAGLAGGARALLVVTSLLVALVGVWSLRRTLAGVLPAFLFLGTVSLFGLVALWHGIFLPKTVLPASFAYFLLLSAGFAASQRRVVLVSAICVVVLLDSSGLARYYSTGSQEGWRESVAYLEENFRSGETVLVDASAGLMPLNYYLDRDHRSIEAHGVPFEPWAVLPPDLTEEDFRRVDEIIAGRQAVWLMIYRNGFPDPDGQLLPYLVERYDLADARSWTKVRAFRFLPRPPKPPLGDGRHGTGARLLSLAESGISTSEGSPSLYFGAWVGERVNVPGDVSQFEKAIGKRLAIVHRYSDNPPHLGNRFDAEWASSARESGAIPMLSWQPGFGYGTHSLASVAAGERDDYVASWAAEIRDWGHPIFLRMMWEQNAAWFPWRADGEMDFVSAWRHVVEVFRSHGATNVTFVWSPHVSGSGASAVMPSYPGDEYVDWVALDGYPFRGGRGDFADTFGPDYDLLVQQVPKPIMIAETSLESWSDELKAQRVHEFLDQQLSARFPEVKALVWFDEKSTDGIDFSLLQGEGPLSQEAFREALASPVFAANWFGNMDTSPIPPPDSAPVGVMPDRSGSEGKVAASPRLPENLLEDPGFEDAGAMAGWGTAWVVPPWVSNVVRLDPSVAASGSYSMSHSSSRRESYVVYQEVPAVAGANYNLSVAVRVDAVQGYGKVALEVVSLNQWGGVIETKPLAAWQEATEGWVQLGGPVKLARGAAKARVQVRVTSLQGTFHLDDFSFARSAT